MTPNLNLRDTVLQGGAYLAIRQAIGTVIGVGGVLLLTRVLGPAQYGLYAAAIGILIAVQAISQLGIVVFLIRRESAIDSATTGTATTLLLISAAVTVMILIAAVPVIVSFTHLTDLKRIAAPLFLSLVVTHMTQVPLAILERKLDYRRTAWAELTAQFAFVVVASALALADFGAYALVMGWWAQQVSLFIMLHVSARHIPQFGWNSAVAKEAIRYGIGYTLSNWLFQLRRLVNPLVVGRYLGAEAVAIVSVTTQIVTNLSFVSVATWRLSTAALSRVQTESARMARAINEGMTLQVLAVAPFLIAFLLVGPFIVSRVMGIQWEQVTTIFPYLALVSLVTSAFLLQASALYVLGRNRSMGIYHVAHTSVLAVVALIAVPRWGLNGYGLAEIATIATFVILHREASRYIPGIRYFVLPKGPLKKIRDFAPVNIVVTSIVKFLVPNPSLELARLLPRTGVIAAELPNGRVLRMWSRADDYIAGPVYWRGWDGYERETSRIFYQHASKASVILDIGAHVGYFTLLSAHATPSGRVFSFEPNPTVVERLRRNVELNRLTNVEVVQKAVGRAVTTAPFYFVPAGIPANSSLSFDYISVCDQVENTEVDVVSIDSFLAERGVDRVDLVKIDTETTESDVLVGMQQTLIRSKPVIFCEILDADAERRIRSLLEPLDYKPRLIGADGRNYLFSVSAAAE